MRELTDFASQRQLQLEQSKGKLGCRLDDSHCSHCRFTKRLKVLASLKALAISQDIYEQISLNLYNITIVIKYFG